MAKLTFDSIKVGDELPTFTKTMTCLGDVMYQAVTWDFARHHYDYKFAESMRLPAPFPDGAVYSAYVARVVTDWCGEAGEIKKYSFKFKTMTFIGDTVVCGGKVEDKFQENGKNFVKLSLWAELADSPFGAERKGLKVIDPASAVVEIL